MVVYCVVLCCVVLYCVVVCSSVVALCNDIIWLEVLFEEGQKDASSTRHVTTKWEKNSESQTGW